MAAEFTTPSLRIQYIHNQRHDKSMRSRKPPPPPPRSQSLYAHRSAPLTPPKPRTPVYNETICLQKCKSSHSLAKNCPLPPSRPAPIYSPNTDGHKTQQLQSRSTRSLPSSPPKLRKHESENIVSPSQVRDYRNDCKIRSSSEGCNESNTTNRRNVRCICGRRMKYTQNPQNQYPPNALLYCQQSTRCKKKMTVQKDWFFYCKSRTTYHETKDGRFYVCYSCSLNLNAKQERIRKNHQLLIKQLKNKDNGHVIITNDTKAYILSSTSSNSKDQTLKLLKQTYIDKVDHNASDAVVMIGNVRRYKVIKEGFMMKKGNVWNKAFKKRYFKLFENKQLFYYKTFENGLASDERGVADLEVINAMTKKGKNGFEISTPTREWKFLCNNSIERDEWWNIIQAFSKQSDDKSYLNKATALGSINPIYAKHTKKDSV